MYRKLIASLTGLALVALCLVIGAGYVAWVTTQQQIRQETEKQAQLWGRDIALRVSTVVQEHHRPLALLSEMRPIQQVLLDVTEGDFDEVNTILDQCALHLEAEVCYLMDRDGLTLASSNRNTPTSFVGHNYQFRPYFQEALSGMAAAYLAKGVTSGTRGMYYAYPVHHATSREVLGVLVAKTGANRIESFLNAIDTNHSSIFVLVDRHGIVFLSNKPSWLLCSLSPIPETELAALLESRQFGAEPPPVIDIRFQPDGTVLTPEGVRYIASEHSIAELPGWKLLRMVPILNESIWNHPASMWISAWIASLVIALVMVGLLYASSLSILRRTEKAIAQISESEAKFREIMDMLPVTVWETDLAGNLAFINPAGIELFGYTPEEAREPVNIFRHMVPEEMERGKAQWIRLLKEGVSSLNQYTLVKKDGTRFPALIRSVLKTVGGKPVGFRGMIVDLTEKVREEEEKLQMQRMMEKSRQLDYLAGLAGGIAHHFNNMLMGILGNASLAAMDLDPQDPKRKKLQHIEDLVKRGAKLTAQLLGFAQGGKYIVEETNLNRMVQNICYHMRSSENAIEWEMDFTDEPCAVRADRKQMEQVIGDVLQNAIQAMPNGGKLTVRTRVETIDRTLADRHEAREGRYFVISIQDTGIGMDEPTMERIFQPFFTTKDVGAGVGMSLASAYGILRNHGGLITVQSKLGQGSSFSLYLPCGEDVLDGGIDVLEVAESGKGTVLLVDDDAMILEIGSKLLERLGYQVITAASGPQAIQFYQAHVSEIDLVILDIAMPEMDGEATYEELKRIDPDIRVIVASGYPIDGKAASILKKGGKDFIQKPFSPKVLAEKIDKALGRKTTTV